MQYAKILSSISLAASLVEARVLSFVGGGGASTVLPSFAGGGGAVSPVLSFGAGSGGPPSVVFRIFFSSCGGPVVFSGVVLAFLFAVLVGVAFVDTGIPVTALSRALASSALSVTLGAILKWVPPLLSLLRVVGRAPPAALSAARAAYVTDRWPKMAAVTSPTWFFPPLGADAPDAIS